MRSRLFVFVAILALWAGAVGARLVQLQVVRHDHYLEVALDQQRRVVELDPPRGAIHDARGRLLAVSLPSDWAFVDPAFVDDPEATARALARALSETRPELDAGRLAERLATGERSISLARKLDPPEAEKLRALALEGVYFVEEAKRYYPMRELAGPLLGFVGDDETGLHGLELAYHAELAGRGAERRLLRDGLKRTAASPELDFSEPEPGARLHLTIDAGVQRTVERELARQVEELGARAGTAILLDPWSGAVLAMASYPGFDPNRFRQVPPEQWRNRAVQDSYEPGSTFKAVTAAAALEAGVLDPSDVLDCELGGITFGRIRINDHRPFGLLTLRQVIAKSSNVGAIKTGIAAGRERLHETITRFGFGRPTGVDLPGESAGILRPLERWQRLSHAYVSFGQEISVTPLQLASAFATIANGGTRYRPYVVAAVEEPDGERRATEPEVLGRPVARSTALQLERMLEAVVEEGTARRAAVPGFRVAGKTGTAQKAEDGRYLPDRFVASFVGFVPARRPRVVALVVLDEPRPPRYHGGDAAAPVFAAIVEQVLLQQGVRPRREPPWGAPQPGGPERPERPRVLRGYRLAAAGAEGAPGADPAALTAGVGTPPGLGAASTTAGEEAWAEGPGLALVDAPALEPSREAPRVPLARPPRLVAPAPRVTPERATDLASEGAP